MRATIAAGALLFLLAAPFVGSVLAAPEAARTAAATPTATTGPTRTPAPTATPDPNRPVEYQYTVNANTFVRCYVLAATATDPRLMVCIEVTNNPKPVN